MDQVLILEELTSTVYVRLTIRTNKKLLEHNLSAKRIA